MVHYSTKLQSNQGLPPRKHHQRKRLRLSGQDPLGSPRKGIHDGPEDTHAINMFNDSIANAQRLEGIVNTKRFRERNDRSQGDRCQSGRSGAIAESWPALDVVGDEVVRVLSRFVLSASGVLGMKLTRAAKTPSKISLVQAFKSFIWEVISFANEDFLMVLATLDMPNAAQALPENKRSTTRSSYPPRGLT